MSDYDDGFSDGFITGQMMSSDGENGEGCYIATAVYGSYDCPEVWTLRRFRDHILRRTVPGRAFVKLYYAVSPSLVRRYGRVDWLRAAVRRPLDRLIARLRAGGMSDQPYQDGKQIPEDDQEKRFF
jgi:hypothetical protein